MFVNYPFLGNYSEHDFSEEQLSTMKEFNDKAKDQVKSIILSCMKNQKMK